MEPTLPATDAIKRSIKTLAAHGAASALAINALIALAESGALPPAGVRTAIDGACTIEGAAHGSSRFIRALSRNFPDLNIQEEADTLCSASDAFCERLRDRIRSLRTPDAVPPPSDASAQAQALLDSLGIPTKRPPEDGTIRA